MIYKELKYCKGRMPRTRNCIKLWNTVSLVLHRVLCRFIAAIYDVRDQCSARVAVGDCRFSSGRQDGAQHSFRRCQTNCASGKNQQQKTEKTMIIILSLRTLRVFSGITVFYAVGKYLKYRQFLIFSLMKLMWKGNFTRRWNTLRTRRCNILTRHWFFVRKLQNKSGCMSQWYTISTVRTTVLCALRRDEKSVPEAQLSISGRYSKHK